MVVMPEMTWRFFKQGRITGEFAVTSAWPKVTAQNVRAKKMVYDFQNIDIRSSNPAGLPKGPLNNQNQLYGAP